MIVTSKRHPTGSDATFVCSSSRTACCAAGVSTTYPRTAAQRARRPAPDRWGWRRRAATWQAGYRSSEEGAIGPGDFPLPFVRPKNPASIEHQKGKVGGGAGNRTRVREASSLSSFTCVAAVSPAAGFADSAATYPQQVSTALSEALSHGPARVVDTFEIRGRPLSLAALAVIKQRERVRCRSQLYVPFGRRNRSRQHADKPSVPTSKPIAPVRWGAPNGAAHKYPERRPCQARASAVDLPRAVSALDPPSAVSAPDRRAVQRSTVTPFQNAT